MGKHVVRLRMLVLFIRFKQRKLENGLCSLKLKLLAVKIKSSGVKGARSQWSSHLMFFGVSSIARFAAKKVLSYFKNH